LWHVPGRRGGDKLPATALAPDVEAATVKSLAMSVLLACALGWPSASPARGASGADLDAQVIGSESFLAAHPDLRHRQLGMKAFLKGDARKALEHFRRAARYADKPSQGMVGELLWEGRGAAADRALAHAWLAVAAERRYEVLERQRDRYWSQLDAGERERARAHAAQLMAEFGDAVAQPRLEAVLRRARSQVTGSRTGATGSLQVIVPGPGGDIRLDGSQFYQDKFWDPEQYWAWQGETWRDARKPQVDVQPLQPR
jgi:hypothetical protein